MSVEKKLIKQFYREHGRYPGDLWTPYHTVALIFFMIGGVSLSVAFVLEALA